MPKLYKISKIYNILSDEPEAQASLINTFKATNPYEDDKRIKSWVKDNIPPIPSNEKSVKIYSIVYDKSEETVREEMIKKKCLKLLLKIIQSFMINMDLSLKEQFGIQHMNN